MKKTIAAYVLTLACFGFCFWLFLIGVADLQAERELHKKIHIKTQINGKVVPR